MLEDRSEGRCRWRPRAVLTPIARSPARPTLGRSVGVSNYGDGQTASSVMRIDPANRTAGEPIPVGVMPDEIAVEILKRCDGTATVAAIVEDLAATFSAVPEQVAADVRAFLQDLADKGMLAL